MGEVDCMGDPDLDRRWVGGIRRTGGDLYRVMGDRRRSGEGDLCRLTGEGDLRRRTGEGDLRRRIGEGDLRRRIGEGDLRLFTGEGDLRRR